MAAKCLHSHRKLAEVDQALSSGEKPPATRPAPQPASPAAADLSFGKLDVSLGKPSDCPKQQLSLVE